MPKVILNPDRSCDVHFTEEEAIIFSAFIGIATIKVTALFGLAKDTLKEYATMSATACVAANKKLPVDTEQMRQTMGKCVFLCGNTIEEMLGNEPTPREVEDVRG